MTQEVGLINMKNKAISEYINGKTSVIHELELEAYKKERIRVSRIMNVNYFSNPKEIKNEARTTTK